MLHFANEKTETEKNNRRHLSTDKSDLKAVVTQEPTMQTIISAVPIMRNGLRSGMTVLRKANITTLKLNQKPLPKQPVPDLKKTAERYLKSLQPLLNDKEYATSKKIVEEFVGPNGMGPKLQAKLIEKFNKTENWMNEWWLHTAYLGYRIPVPFHSSPGSVGPRIDFKNPEDAYMFAARVITAICDFNNILKSGKIKQEMARDQPLDMQPYGMVLGTHRRPCKKLDQLLHTDNSKHIIIMCNNNFFKLCVLTDSGVVPENKLISSIKDIAERSCKEGKPVGILTGNDRDSWAQDHCILSALGNNKNIIKDIEDSLFLLCLDKEVPKEAFKQKNHSSVRAVECMIGINSCANANNRWHDKCVQFVVSMDGCVGMAYEHSPCEGVAIAVLHDHIINYATSKENQLICDSPPKDFPKAELLEFKINDEVECAIEKATEAVDKLADDMDMECYIFDSFGGDKIKEMKLSPDSFIQTALQVAYYRLHGKPPVHYESAALRRFANSRTECIRTTSCDAVKFARMMSQCDPCISKAEKKEAMITAINAHKTLANEAALGQGVDRPLFGLRMIAKEEGLPLPEIFKDVGYTRSTQFTLTSSQVPYKTESYMCYGPVVPDGYGCCYNPRPKDIIIACSSFKSCSSTNTKDFACALQRALCDMKDLGSS